MSVAAPRPRHESQIVTVAHALSALLERSGLDFMPMVPGGPLMPFLAAAYGSKLRPVLARHECGAAFMADGYYRATGRMAAVCATAGPGTTNLVTGVTVAQREQVPMFVIAAEVATTVSGRGAAQELDPIPLLSSITKRAVSLRTPDRIVDTVLELLQLAVSGRPGPVVLTVPTNLFDMPLGAAAAGRLASAEPPCHDRYFDASAIAELARRLSAARRPVLLAGYGAVQSRASAQLYELSHRNPRLLVATTPRAKGVFPEGHPQSLGVFGFAGTRAASKAILEDCDLLFVVGSRLGELSTCGWHADLARRPLVQLDIDPTEPGRVLPVAQRVVGDAAATLEALLETLPAATLGQRLVTHVPPATLDDVDDRVPIAPARLMSELDRRLPQDCPLFVDIGNSMAWALHLITRTQPNFHVNLVFGCMGHAVPAAIGACLGTGRTAFALTGDAALLMTGSELAVAAQQNLPLVTVCLNDAGHGFVEVGREVMFKDALIPAMRFEPAPDLCRWASALGVHGISLEDPRHLAPALEAALMRAGPTLLDVRVDPSARPEVGQRLETLAAQWPSRRTMS